MSAPAGQPAWPEPQPARERRGGDRVGLAHILLVEDSATTRSILRGQLEAAGYRVSEAIHGEAALASAAVEPPDLVLLDLEMPVMDGQAFLVHIRAHERLAELPVVVLTAQHGSARVAAAFAAGAQDYVRKTCSDRELEARITSVLGRVHEERELRERIAYIDRLSSVDELTGLGNRRALDRYRERMVTAGRGERPVGLIVLDVDHFKRVNDREGHLVGDAVLRVLARRLEAALDPGQLLVRWGGEEFVVVAPGLDDAAVRELAERLHEVVGATPCALEGRDALAVTVSAGCTSGPVREIEHLVSLADEALYAAKGAGRDCVVTYGA